MRWVIVAEGNQGLTVFGPGRNQTYALSERAVRDADRIRGDYDMVYVLTINQIEKKGDDEGQE